MLNCGIPCGRLRRALLQHQAQKQAYERHSRKVYAAVHKFARSFGKSALANGEGDSTPFGLGTLHKEKTQQMPSFPVSLLDFSKLATWAPADFWHTTIGYSALSDTEQCTGGTCQQGAIRKLVSSVRGLLQIALA